MSKSQEQNDNIYENNSNLLDNNLKQKNPPVKYPIMALIILLIVICLAINYFFVQPEKSIGGKLPKNEYIHHMDNTKKDVAPQTNDDIIINKQGF